MRWSRLIQLGSLLLMGLMILLLVAPLAAACGGEARETDEEQIRSSVNGLFQALEEEDWNTAYDFMSPGYRAQCPFLGFERLAKGAMARIGPVSSLAVANITVDKEQAQGTVTWETSERRGEKAYFFLKREGTWLIAPDLDPQRGDEEICDW